MIGMPIGNSRKTNFCEFIGQDRAIRAAIGGCSADEFRKALTDMYNAEKAAKPYWEPYICCCELEVSLILSVLCRHEKLKAFYEVQRTFDIQSDTPEHAKYSLLVSCLLNDDESAEYIIRNELDFSDFSQDWYLVNPLYFLMITGKYRLLDIALDRCCEIFGKMPSFDTDESDMFINREFPANSLPFIAASAAYFGDRDFLAVLFDKGYRMDEDIIVQLYPEPAAMELIIGNFYDKIGMDKPVSIYEFIREKFSTKKILRMALQICQIYDSNACERFIEKVSPIKKIDVLDDYTIMMYSSYVWQDTDKGKLFLNDLAEKELTVTLDDHNFLDFYEIEGVFTDHSITFDLSYCNIGIFKTLSVKQLKDILMRNVIFCQSDIDSIRQAVLDRNSKQLTKLLIGQGMINKDNYEEVLDYVISNKYLNSLAVLKNAEFLK